MFRYVALALILFAVTGARSQEQKDLEGATDHPLLSRMPGFFITGAEVKDFDSYESAYVPGADARWEGKLTKLEYNRLTGAKSVSMTQIERNYENAITKLGGKVLYKDARVVEGKVQKGGGVTYVHVAAFNEGEDYELVVVETKPMEQEVTVDAAALKQSLGTTGKAAVYGIYFDTDKSVIKPASTPALEEITKLLKQNAGLRLYIVGHTDNVGNLDHNLKLSADRAAAVVKALADRGIQAARLKPAGVGPYSPEASNKTEEGRARNRRVELVSLD